MLQRMYGNCIPQTKVDQLIISFIVEYMEPLSIVEAQPFINLIQGLQPTRKVMTKRMLDGRLNSLEDEVKRNVIKTLSKVVHVCMTADIWSTNNKSFLGVTAHWIDSASLQRQSGALCCEHLKGAHTYDSIAVRLNTVHNAYRIRSKVLMTVTDNGSNFVKAFQEYKLDVDTDCDADDENITFVNVEELLKGPGHEDNEFYLPPHQRCASHTLNLIASHDIDMANNDGNYKKIFRSTMAKCSTLWNKTSRSTKFADIVHEKLQTCFIFPNATRWNSYFNAIDKIRQVIDRHSEDKITDVFQALEVPAFRPNEKMFLKEYCSVMKPLASALEILQAESKCFIGYLLPTLASLRTKLLAIKPTLKMAVPLADAVLKSLDRRFECYDLRDDLIICKP